MKKSFLTLILCILTGSCFGFNIKKLGAENGLSNNNVVSIAQDRDNFIWICTKDGLNRFDGNKFQVFKHADNDTNTICSNVLNYVFADRFDDVVWIASEKNGLDAYNYKTHKIRHFRHSNNDKNSLSTNGITHITADKQGNIWLATYSGGIERIDKKTNQITHYNQSNVRGLVSDFNWYVMEDEYKRLYVGHVTNGLSIIDLKTRTAINFNHNPNDATSLCDYTVTCIFKDSRNRIWVGTRNGLALFNPAIGKFINFRNIFENPNSLSGNFIKSIVETKDHKLWIGTEGNGISILDMNQLNGSFTPLEIIFRHIGESNTDEGLSGTSVQTVIQDSFGNFWVGGFICGVNFISNKNELFRKISYLPYIGNQNSLANTLVLGLCTDRDNRIWVANGPGGVSVYDNHNKIKSFQQVDPSHKQINTSAIHRDHQNNIWIGCADGKLYKYNPRNQSFENIKLAPEANTPIYSLHHDTKNHLWIGCDGGLYKLDLTSSQITFYNAQNSKLSDNSIRALQEDKDGNIWIGSLSGALQVFDKNMNLKVILGKQADFYTVNQIYRDSRNRMWVATQNDLLLFTSPNISTLKRFGKKIGFAENFITAVIEGRNADEVWFSTTNGISFLNIRKNTVLNFGIADDIAAGDYAKGAVAKNQSGEIYFGSQHGITYLNQNATDLQTITVTPRITSFWVADKAKQHLTDFQNIPFSDTNKLNYTQNSFQLNFNVLDYSLNNKVEFMYKMSGLDDSWYFIGKEKQVTFRNLRPGKYIFQIKARLQNKEWQANVTSIVIIIKPPFWLTWWATTLYALIVLCIIAYVFRFYQNRIKLENSLYLERQNNLQQQELNNERLRFYTNITHELRTPLTLIIGPLEDLMNDIKMQDSYRGKIQTIYKSALRLLDLINQILEFRKTETQNRKLCVLKTDMTKQISDIARKYWELNRNPGLTITCQIEDGNFNILYDPEVITIVLDNLISNAIKYTPSGEINLVLRQLEENGIGYTEIEVHDTGYGIDQASLPFIFDRYYQVNNKHQASGTGIGLAIVKNLVELHDAEVSVTSQPEEGTIFRIRLITGNTYPNALHMETRSSNPEEKLDDTRPIMLVVEDNEDIRQYIAETFTEEYEVLTASNGREGLDIALSRIPDIIISDVMMPIMDGTEFCKKVKEDLRTSHIPFIMLTAKDTIQDKTDGYFVGADSYLTKPFSGILLRSRIINLMETRRRIAAQFEKAIQSDLTIQEKTPDLINPLDNEFISKITMYVEEHLTDENINIASIADIVFMSHSTLYRKVKALTGLTTNELIRKIRLQHARNYLATGKYNITEVMYMIGISSNTYFRSCFKEEFGISPSDLIKRSKK